MAVVLLSHGGQGWCGPRGSGPVRHRLEGNRRIVRVFVRAEEELAAAQQGATVVEAEKEALLQAVEAKNQARVTKVDAGREPVLPVTRWSRPENPPWPGARRRSRRDDGCA